MYSRALTELANKRLSIALEEESKKWKKILEEANPPIEPERQAAIIEKMKLSYQVDVINRIKADYPKALQQVIERDRGQPADFNILKSPDRASLQDTIDPSNKPADYPRIKP